MNDVSALWGNPLDDRTRAEFEREFPELSTPDLCSLAIMYRERKQYALGRLSPDSVVSELAKTQAAIDGALQRLLEMSDEEDEAVSLAAAKSGSPPRREMIEALRNYRSAIWVAERMADDIRRGRPSGDMRWLVAVLCSRFEAASLPINADQDGRFMRAIRIVLAGANDVRANDKDQRKSLSVFVRRILREFGKL